MSDYVIHAKLKNANLLRRILATSKNVAEFCRDHNLGQSEIGDLINLKTPALLQTREWCSTALKLADIFGCLPDELFVEEQQTLRLLTNQVMIERSRREILESRGSLESLERSIDTKRLLGVLTGALNEREERVVKMLHMEGKTLREIGAELKVTQERVRHIDAKAMQKMRRMANATNLTDEAHNLVVESGDFLDSTYMEDAYEQEV
jgi:DNA-binding CsgD family transcriptional regulator